MLAISDLAGWSTSHPLLVRIQLRWWRLKDEKGVLRVLGNLFLLNRTVEKFRLKVVCEGEC